MSSENPSTELLAPLDAQAMGDPGRYSQEHTEHICQLLARYTDYPVIVASMQRAFRRTFPFKHYAYFRRAPRWQPLIATLRQEYLADMDDVPIAQQRIRLERLEKLYQDAKEPRLKILVLRAASDELKDPRIGTQTNVSITAYYRMSAEELEQKRVDVINKLRHLKAQEKADGSAGGSDGISEA